MGAPSLLWLGTCATRLRAVKRLQSYFRLQALQVARDEAPVAIVVSLCLSWAMQKTFSATRQMVDLETWERTAVFNFFKNFTEPYHGVCVHVECTATHRYAKDYGISVFLSLVHRALAAAHQVENFHTRIVNGEVWRYEQIHGGSAVGRPNGTIGFAHYGFYERIDDFVRVATPEVERVRQRTDIARYPEPNLIRFSTLPWLDFSSISHARNLAEEDSAPRITFGKITEADGRRTMPVSIHAHHALADGLHVAQFVEHFQNLLNTPDACIGPVNTTGAAGVASENRARLGGV